jgi:hypothetical protein
MHALVPFCLALPTMAFFLTSVQGQEAEFMADRHVVILSVYPSFPAAKADAEKIARASGVPFSMEGRVHDRERGLIYPDDFPDEVFRGSYVARRFDTTWLPGAEAETRYLSVERSDGYEGFKPGFYMVVAGIESSPEAAAERADRFRAWAPTAYAKKARIYLGCLH